MSTVEEKIATLFEGLRQVQAENWALKHLVLAMYAQGPDINKVMRHFLKAGEEVTTYNTFSTLPEDFVTSFDAVWRQLVKEMQLAVDRAPKMHG